MHLTSGSNNTHVTCLFAFCAAISAGCFFGVNALLLRLLVEVSPGHRTLPLHPGFTGAKCVLKTFVARVQTFVVGVSFVYGRLTSAATSAFWCGFGQHDFQ